MICWQLAGAFCFGFLIGWYVYFINRYRKGEVQLSDLVTLLGAIGGGAVLALFKAESDLFGAYGIGLLVGFLGYFGVLVFLVRKSQNFDFDWFLDGRRKNPADGYGYGVDQRPPVTPMSATGQAAAGVGIHAYGNSVAEVQSLLPPPLAQ